MLMESLSMTFLSSPPLQTPKPHFSKPKPKTKTKSTHFSNPLQNPIFTLKTSPSSQTPTKPHLPFLLTNLFASLPCFASEPATVPVDQASDKINLEAIVVSIDDFFNRNPFFVAGVTFIWLVVVPLTQEYLKKYKFISAIDAFRKLRDDPSSQLLDIRDKKILAVLRSPNLKILSKSVAQVQFSEGDEDGFVKKVLERFADPANTVVCVLDNFDGNSMKVAELLFKNGFKEAYAIRGGVIGKKGWQAIQEDLLPPSVHIYRKKKVKRSQKFEMDGGVNQWSEDKYKESSERMDNGYVNLSTESITKTKINSRSSSPYPNYPDLKPPSSPTPARPRT